MAGSTEVLPDFLSYTDRVPFSAANELTGIGESKEILYERIILAKNATEATSTFKSNAFIAKAMSVYTNKKLYLFL